MFLSIFTATTTFLVSFDPIDIIVYEGTDTSVLLGEIPTVSASVVDTGITVVASTASVVISGKYQSLFPVKWYWKDLEDVLQSGNSPPPAGTYLKLVQVDSPSSSTEDCIYTITSSEGSNTFRHQVNVDYDIIATELTELLGAQPGP
jgi:hypothetical protein